MRITIVAALLTLYGYCALVDALLPAALGR